MLVFEGTIFFNGIELLGKDKEFIEYDKLSICFNRFGAFVSRDSGISSILPIDDYTKKIIIETTTLDKEIEKIQNKIKLIKVEAEGFEPEILQGLKKYLNYVEYITIDCGFERGIKQESTIAKCSNYLIKNNFEMIDFGKSRLVTLFKNLEYNS